MENLPKYVHRRKRDGAVLFRKRHGQKIIERKLIHQFSEGTEMPEEAALEVSKLTGHLMAPSNSGGFLPQQGNGFWENGSLTTFAVKHFANMEKAARYRASKGGVSYLLPRGWCADQFIAQGMMCAVTGVCLYRSRLKHSPFMPSLDRIKPGANYSASNCRIVSYIANCAINQFSSEEFLIMCRGAVRVAEIKEGTLRECVDSRVEP